jgi:hypothetical protein
MNLDKCFCRSDVCARKKDCDRHHSVAFEFFNQRPDMRKSIYQSDFYEENKDCEVFEPKEINEHTRKN